jgi:hypothetical protein
MPGCKAIHHTGGAAKGAIQPLLSSILPCHHESAPPFAAEPMHLPAFVAGSAARAGPAERALIQHSGSLSTFYRRPKTSNQ